MLFDKDYYVNSKISNYEDYRQKKFSGLADDLYPYLRHRRVLDYGAATGGLIQELISRYVYCEGTDISYWAVEYGKKHYDLEHFLHHYNPALLSGDFDVILFLDVLEHIPDESLYNILNKLKAVELIVRIPVSKMEGADFVLDVSKNDKTHIQIHSKQWWLDLFSKCGYSIRTVLKKEYIYDSDGVLAVVLTKSTTLD